MNNSGSILFELLVLLGIGALAWVWFHSAKDPHNPLTGDVRSVLAACGVVLLAWKIWDAWRSR